MSKPINTPFTANFPGPIDTRLQVNNYAGLGAIPIVYIGLKVYVVDDNKEYRYYSGGWQEWSGGSGGGGAGVWGAITGTLADQADLLAALNLKYDKTGGIITGDVTVQANAYAYDFIVYGSGPSAPSPYPEITTVPLTASSTGTINQIAFDANFFYVCIATDTWVRGILATW